LQQLIREKQKKNFRHQPSKTDMTIKKKRKILGIIAFIAGFSIFVLPFIWFIYVVISF